MEFTTELERFENGVLPRELPFLNGLFEILTSEIEYTGEVKEL